MTDREYLSKPVLPNMKYEITDNRIYIANENTVFIQANNIEKFRQEDILDKYKELLAVCKKNGVKISYTNKYKSYLLDIWPRYVKDVEDYKKFYNELKKKAEIVKKRGIHYGCSDDIALKDMTEFSYNLNSYQYRVSSISQVTEIYNTIINHIRNINREFQYSPDIVGYRIYL